MLEFSTNTEVSLSLPEEFVVSLETELTEAHQINRYHREGVRVVRGSHLAWGLK